MHINVYQVFHNLKINCILNFCLNLAHIVVSCTLLQFLSTLTVRVKYFSQITANIYSRNCELKSQATRVDCRIRPIKIPATEWLTTNKSSDGLLLLKWFIWHDRKVCIYGTFYPITINLSVLEYFNCIKLFCYTGLF